MTVAVVLVGFISGLANIFMHLSYFGGGDRDRGPLIAVAAVLAMILAPLAAQLMQLAVSRRREFLADASGALLTRYPEGLASALRKIGSYQAPMERATATTAHLFIANPFGAHPAGQFFAKLFSTHPPGYVLTSNGRKDRQGQQTENKQSIQCFGGTECSLPQPIAGLVHCTITLHYLSFFVKYPKRVIVGNVDITPACNLAVLY
jgi:hypothetical protein